MKTLFVFGIIGAALASCSAAPGTDAGVTATATATINEAGGAQGTVTFEDTAAGLRVKMSLTGVPGDGDHGAHLHATGDCGDNAGPDGGPVRHGAAGGHYNPNDAGHACPPTTPRHAGDLGNITITGGAGSLEVTTSELSVAKVLGKSIVLHSAPDDCTSQPAGNSGSRIGCAVISAQ